MNNPATVNYSPHSRLMLNDRMLIRRTSGFLYSTLSQPFGVRESAG